jgi:hypothetical protein
MRSSNVRERGLRGEKLNPLMLIDVDVQDDLPHEETTLLSRRTARGARPALRGTARIVLRLRRALCARPH